MKQEEASADEAQMEQLLVLNIALTKRCGDYEEQVSTLNARLLKAEELALAKQSDNSELRNLLAQLEIEMETLPILRAQVESKTTSISITALASNYLFINVGRIVPERFCG